jgi:hypothetical protein
MPRAPVSLYSSSTGQLRAAIDLLLAELHAARRDPVRSHQLVGLVQDVAELWHLGADRDEIAEHIFVEVAS